MKLDFEHTSIIGNYLDGRWYIWFKAPKNSPCKFVRVEDCASLNIALNRVIDNEIMCADVADINDLKDHIKRLRICIRDVLRWNIPIRPPKQKQRKIYKEIKEENND